MFSSVNTQEEKLFGISAFRLSEDALLPELSMTGQLSPLLFSFYYLRMNKKLSDSA